MEKMKQYLCFSLRSQHPATEEQQLAYPMPQLKSLVPQPLCWAWSGGRSPGVGHVEPHHTRNTIKKTHYTHTLQILHFSFATQNCQQIFNFHQLPQQKHPILALSLRRLIIHNIHRWWNAAISGSIKVLVKAKWFNWRNPCGESFKWNDWNI